MKMPDLSLFISPRSMSDLDAQVLMYAWTSSLWSVEVISETS